MGGFDGQLRARKENDEALLEHAHVALVPGAAFLDEGFCRKCNTFCFKTFLPLMIFMNVYNSDLESAVQPGAFLFAAAAVLVIFAAAFLIIPRIVKKGNVDSAGSPVSAASRQAGSPSRVGKKVSAGQAWWILVM